MTGRSSPPVEEDAAEDIPRRTGRGASLLTAAANSVRSLTFFQGLFAVYMAAGLLVMTFLVPPFQKPDEPSHYYRAVSVSNFDFVCTKDRIGVYKVDMKAKFADLPEIVHVWDVAFDGSKRFDPDWLRADFSNPLLNEEKRVYDICNLPPPGYYPNVVGIWLGKPFENPLYGFYLGRFTGALFFAVCLVFALRLTPERYRLPVYFFAALPMVLHQAGAISYDTAQLPLFLVLYGYVTKFAVAEHPIARRDLVIFGAALIFAINIRSLTYVPLAGLFLALPAAKVAATRAGYLKATSAFFGAATVITAALAAVYVPRVSAIPVVEGDVSASRQLTFILENPGKFIGACYLAVREQGNWLLMQTMGIFGWLDAPMNYFPYYVLVFVLGLVFFQVMQDDRRVVGGLSVFFLYATVAATIACLFLSLYIVWTPVGYPQVLGLQGRYFIGLLPFTIFAVSQHALIIGRRRFLNAMFVVLAIILIYNMYRTIDLRYYGPAPEPAVQQEVLPAPPPDAGAP